jgi:hypothetical protein
LLLHISWRTVDIGTVTAVPFETLSSVTDRFAFVTNNMVASFANDFVALASFLDVTSSAIELEALVVQERITFWTCSSDTNTILHLLVWSAGLLVAGVSDSDFSWATLNSLADTVDVLLTNWAGDWMTRSDDGGGSLNSDFDTFGSNSLESCWAGDKRDNLLSSDTLVSSWFEFSRALGNTLSISVSEPSFWTSEPSFVGRHSVGIFSGILNLPGDGLPLVSSITRVCRCWMSWFMFGMVVHLMFVMLLGRRSRS